MYKKKCIISSTSILIFFSWQDHQTTNCLEDYNKNNIHSSWFQASIRSSLSISILVLLINTEKDFNYFFISSITCFIMMNASIDNNQYLPINDINTTSSNRFYFSIKSMSSLYFKKTSILWSKISLECIFCSTSIRKYVYIYTCFFLLNNENFNCKHYFFFFHINQTKGNKWTCNSLIYQTNLLNYFLFYHDILWIFSRCWRQWCK